MATAIKAKETAHYIDIQKPVDDKKKMKLQSKKDADALFSGKTFNDLTGPEKDDLLKALAIQAGIIEE